MHPDWPGEFEVSSRTVKRDIDFMKCRLELPIEYDERRYGYFYARPVDRFPGIRITEPELFALLVAQKAVAQYHGTPFEQPLETAFRKLTAQLSADSEYTFHNLEQALSFRPLGPEDTDLKLFQRLNTALRRAAGAAIRIPQSGRRQTPNATRRALPRRVRRQPLVPLRLRSRSKRRCAPSP